MKIRFYSVSEKVKFRNLGYILHSHIREEHKYIKFVCMIKCLNFLKESNIFIWEKIYSNKSGLIVTDSLEQFWFPEQGLHRIKPIPTPMAPGTTHEAPP